MAPRRRRSDRHRTRGTVMVLFAMVTVVLLGMLALVIELGIVRGGRQRMQAASDAAALEVLRERDFVRPELGSDDPLLRDQDRRLRNRLMASWPFAGNGLAQSYSESAEGAGAYVTLESQAEPGDNPMNQGLVLGATGSSIPLLQANDGGNAKHGDIVSGQFTGHDPNAPVGYGGNPIRREESDYDRVDFQPASPGDAPFADSVLVRMRRTVPYGSQGSSPWSSLDVQSGVSSSGYTMPLLFGLGTPFTAQDPSAGYSVRHHGLAMRSTSIAQARPAVRVGAPGSSPDGVEWAVGGGPISMRLAEWNYEDGSWQTDPVTNEVFTIIRFRPPDYEFVVVDHDVFVAGYMRPKAGAQVGDPILEDELTPVPDGNGGDANFEPSYWTVSECFIPLYVRGNVAQPPFSEQHVCGFGRVRIEPAPPPTDDGETDPEDIFMRVTKLRNESTPGSPWIAPRNAAATFDGTQPSVVFANSIPGDVNAQSWGSLIENLMSLPQPDPNNPFNPFLPDARVYAPALVR